ncbi:MAG: hypothetical protein AAGN35_11705 [Bacteroidota bacterium]
MENQPAVRTGPVGPEETTMGSGFGTHPMDATGGTGASGPPSMPPANAQLTASGGQTAPAREATSPGEAETEGRGVLSAPVDLSTGTFAPATAEDEQLIEQAGPAGLRVAVQVANFAQGEMHVMRNGQGFQTLGEGRVFLPVSGGFLADIFGGTVQFGIEAEVRNNAVLGQAVMQVAGQVVSRDGLGEVFGALNLPGIELGENLSQAELVNSFVDGEFRLQVINIPIVTGNQFSGSIDIGLIDGEPSLTGKAVLNVTPSIVGEVELTFSGTSMSGEGSIAFLQGPISGELVVSMTEDNVVIEGRGTVATDRFSGDATILYGRKSYVESVIGPQLAALQAGQEAEAPEGGYEPDAGTGEWELAGFAQGTVPISDQFAANATGIVDPTGGVTLGMDIGNSDQIPLTDAQAGNYEMEVGIPVFTWGFKKVAGISVNIKFYFDLGYKVSPILLEQASLSGVYSNSSHPLAPANSLNLDGEAAVDARVEVGGGIGVEAEADVAGNRGALEIGAKMSATLDAAARLAANLGITAGPEGIDPHFTAEGAVSAALNLNLQGYLKATFDGWGERFDKEVTRYFANVIIPVGDMNLEFAYDPDLDPPIRFGAPEPGENIFSFNSWDEMMTQMHEAPEMPAGSVEGFSPPESDSENPDADGPITTEQESDVVGVRLAYQNPQGEVHNLVYEEHDGEVEIWRHSKALRLEDYCATLIQHYQGSEDAAKVERLQTIQAELENEAWKQDMKHGMETPELRQNALAAIQRITQELREIDQTAGDTPEAPDGPTATPAGRPTKAILEKLHRSQGVEGEASDAFRLQRNADPQSDGMSASWRWLELNLLTGTWIKFHVINHHLGGKADSNNLIAAPKTVNSQFSANFEEHLKALYREGKVIWMEADIDYHRSGLFEIGRSDSVPRDTAIAFPRSFSAKGGQMTFQDGEWRRLDPAELQFDAPIPLPQMLPEGVQFSVNDPLAYTKENLKKFNIWRSNGKRMENAIAGGKSLVDDSEKYIEKIFTHKKVEKRGWFRGNGYDPKKWPDFKINDLPEVSNGLLTMYRNCDSGNSSKKRTIKHFLVMIKDGRIKF